MNQSRLCCLHGFCMDTKGQVLCLCQTIVTSFHLVLEHASIFISDLIEAIRLMRNCNALLELLRIGCHVHETQLKMHGTIKEVKEGTPFLKDLCLILLLCQLIIDVLELNRLSIVISSNSADAILEHSVERDALLCGSGNSIILLCCFDDLPHLFLIFIA